MVYPPIAASQCADQLGDMASDTKSIENSIACYTFIRQ